MYFIPVFCCLRFPRRSRSGPIHAQTDPQTRPCLSRPFLTLTGSMWEGSSTGISTVSKPHFLKVGNNRVLLVVNGEVNRKLLIVIAQSSLLTYNDNSSNDNFNNSLPALDNTNTRTEHIANINTHDCSSCLLATCLVLHC